MKRLLLLTIVLFWGIFVSGQSAQQVIRRPDSLHLQNTGNSYYLLGLRYKNGDGVPIDYTKAFENFQKASDLGDAQSTYAVAYMHYKGLGCPQNYQLAGALFAKGAYAGRDNSMYFYGLCFRNGYGLDRNEDSATYWLTKAASMDYTQAKQELLTKAGENANDSAGALIQKIHNAALPTKVVLNEFRQIEPHILSQDLIAGDYTGYLLAYDWSGRHIISNKTLHLTLENKDNSNNQNGVYILTGAWTEKGSAPVLLKASLKADSLVFQDSRYSVKDHYTGQRAVAYEFTSANLNLVHSGDSVYLAGNVSMFSPDRKEPSKPMFIALQRMEKSQFSSDSLFKMAKKDSTNAKEQPLNARLLSVYPNPFRSELNVRFEVLQATKVEVQLYTIGGAFVYKIQSKQMLTNGQYTITLKPGRLASGSYLLRLVFANGAAAVKVINE